MEEKETKERIEREIGRGFQARAILQDPLFAESMKRMKQEIIDMWTACPARDTAGREFLWMYHQAAIKFEETLTTVLNTGKLAVKERDMSLAEKVGQTIRRVI